MTNTQQVANEILRQLRADGPLGSLAAIGAREFMSSDENGNPKLTFRITITPRRRHYIEVILDANDTYTMRLVHVPMRGARKFSREIEREESGIYCDQLTGFAYEFGTAR